MPRLQEAERLEALATQIRSCAQCPLHATRTKAVPGEGMPSARVMLIGEAPGRDEDQRGQPFVGAAGRFLDEMRSEEHTSELQSQSNLVCRLLLEKKKSL